MEVKKSALRLVSDISEMQENGKATSRAFFWLAKMTSFFLYWKEIINICLDPQILFWKRPSLMIGFGKENAPNPNNLSSS